MVGLQLLSPADIHVDYRIVELTIEFLCTVGGTISQARLDLRRVSLIVSKATSSLH